MWAGLALLLASGQLLGARRIHTITFDDAENLFSPGSVVTEVRTEAGIVSVRGVGPRNPQPNDAMIFDATCERRCAGGDDDLRQPDQGNILIVSEGGLATDPNDSGFGGWLSFDFSRIGAVDIESLLVIDLEASSPATARLYRGAEKIAELPLPTPGDGSLATAEIGVAGVERLEIEFRGSGAIDDLKFRVAAPAEGAQEPASEPGPEPSSDTPMLPEGGPISAPQEPAAPSLAPPEGSPVSPPVEPPSPGAPRPEIPADEISTTTSSPSPVEPAEPTPSNLTVSEGEPNGAPLEPGSPAVPGQVVPEGVTPGTADPITTPEPGFPTPPSAADPEDEPGAPQTEPADPAVPGQAVPEGVTPDAGDPITSPEPAGPTPPSAAAPEDELGGPRTEPVEPAVAGQVAPEGEPSTSVPSLLEPEPPILAPARPGGQPPPGGTPGTDPKSESGWPPFWIWVLLVVIAIGILLAPKLRPAKSADFAIEHRAHSERRFVSPPRFDTPDYQIEIRLRGRQDPGTQTLNED